MYSLIESATPKPTLKFLRRVAKEFAIAAKHENGGKDLTSSQLAEWTRTYVMSDPMTVKFSSGDSMECPEMTHMLAWKPSGDMDMTAVICIVIPREGDCE